MAIGRTFKEALQKALRSLEIKRFGLLGDGADKDVDLETLRLKLAIPNADRIFYIAQAFQKGASIDEAYELTKIDRWFLRNIAEVVAESGCLKTKTFLRAKEIRFLRPTTGSRAKRFGDRIRSTRKAEGVVPMYRLVERARRNLNVHALLLFDIRRRERATRERQRQDHDPGWWTEPDRPGH